jgi:hypothetical protein
LILRDGQGEIDLALDIDNEQLSLVQGDQVLGRFSLNEVHFVRITQNRILLSLRGETADFYPFRPEEFIATLLETRPS